MSKVSLPEGYITIDAAAAAAGVSRTTIGYWRDIGLLGIKRFSARRHGVLVEELEAVMRGEAVAKSSVGRG